MSEAAVACTDVWKVFGRLPPAALAAARAGALGPGEARTRYGAVIAVAEVTFAVRRGEVFCIMGLSGSGKSTLVRHLNGLVRPTAGAVTVEGADLARLSRGELRALRAAKIGMVFQGFGLLPHRSVIENVAFGLELRGVPRARRMRVAEDTLALVQLEGWADRRPDELSGGMQQRVGIARALAGDPAILLMDEPFSALDPLIRRQLQDQFQRLSRAMRKTTVFITHDFDEAVRLGDRVAIMREGRFVQVGTADEIIARPADAYVAAFVGAAARPTAASAIGGGRPPATPGDVGRHWPRVPHDLDLDRLVDLALEVPDPVVVLADDGAMMGVVDRVDLLRAMRRARRPDRAEA